MSIYQFTIVGTSPGPNALRNIHHYEFPGYVPTTGELEEAMQVLADAYGELLQPQHTNSITYNSIEYRRVDVGDLPTNEYIPTGWPFSGTASGNMFPPQVSALLVWKAGTTFPRSTRTYLFPFATATGSATGTILLTVRTVMENFANAIEELDVTGQPPAQKVAVAYGGTPRAVVASNLVSATVPDSVFATQRSRRYGVGI